MADPGTPVEDWVHLEPWEEVTGKLIDIDDVGGWLTVRLTSGTLVFKSDSIEAQLLREDLPKFTDSTVSILRTDLENEPVVIASRSTGGVEL